MHTVILVYIHLTQIREIFGPILAVVPVKDVDNAIEFINARYVVWDAYSLHYTHSFPQGSSSRSVCVLERHSLPRERCVVPVVALVVRSDVYVPSVFSNTKSGTAVANETVIIVGGMIPCTVVLEDEVAHGKDRSRWCPYGGRRCQWM